MGRPAGSGAHLGADKHLQAVHDISYETVERDEVGEDQEVTGTQKSCGPDTLGEQTKANTCKAEPQKAGMNGGTPRLVQSLSARQ